ncbi:tRNA glutamyl-Q(34) synthetase GluQRS [Leisingera sp. M658]|uniref:tRNA glutamyl-Q(34) synthetase GluQRS n=1 Tax=Leisingera sp. M658 TaxID=2867015 RepID=UPI0021A62FED|nr:tRNA glutamyl-Q(34) synthetase GluQRS [Leisingera sp. M658]UWQ76860.1 tRNA glutamyl-Q(34) synthetase GluQRS [Leisingera sp. M658]
MTFTTRFAPSPTGPLHLGHAYSAILAHDMAIAEGGSFLLRIEDIDQSRARPEWEAQIYEDLSWLGLSWQVPAIRQSDRTELYKGALSALAEMDVLFPCWCKRADIETAASAPQEGVPRFGADGLVYPGTCRWRKTAHAVSNDVLRLNIEKAMECPQVPEQLSWHETGQGRNEIRTYQTACLPQDAGDVILRRKGMDASYHLSVVLDDTDQNVTHVVRGADLEEATPIHALLQRLLGLPTPIYHHHHLIRDDQGKRLAKRDDARAIAKYRAEGATPQDIREMVGLPLLSG